MRVFAIISTLLGAAVVVSAVAAPQPASKTLKQFTRKDFVLKEKYPELFGKRGDPDPPQTSDGTVPCNWQRKRWIPTQILTGEEAALFLIGRGEFTSPSNATTYHDPHYRRQMDEDLRSVERRSWLHNVVRDKVGNALLEVSIPFYKRWKAKFAGDEARVIALSGQTGLRARDLRQLGRSLLDNPDFEELQVAGYRVNRRFIKAVQESLYDD